MAFETSAKEDINVANTFEEIAKQIFVGYLASRKFTQVGNPKQDVALSHTAKKQCC